MRHARRRDHNVTWLETRPQRDVRRSRGRTLTRKTQTPSSPSASYASMKRKPAARVRRCGSCGQHEHVKSHVGPTWSLVSSENHTALWKPTCKLIWLTGKPEVRASHTKTGTVLGKVATRPDNHASHAFLDRGAARLSEYFRLHSTEETCSPFRHRGTWAECHVTTAS